MKTDDEQIQVSRDAAYEQLYHEMRRHRDYQVVICGWYATLALGVVAGLLGMGKLNIELPSSLAWVFAVLVTLAGFGVCYVVWYSHDRYEALRNFTDENAEPEWKRQVPMPERRVKPHHVLIAIDFMLTLAIVIVLAVVTQTMVWTFFASVLLLLLGYFLGKQLHTWSR